MYTQLDLIDSIKNNNISLLKKILKQKNINPSYNDSHSIRTASYYGLFDMVKLLIKDGNVDPSAVHNSSIIYAYNKKNQYIIDMIWKDKRVRNKQQKI